ncbi:MAG: ligase-associated DNA damage response DEXH box helicase [Rhodospirillales bacterium]|nr:ligase-associated DNA damage response DEXH box helicase [Rhodospirillales bacterium]
MDGTFPEPFAGWFAARGWQPRPHQRAMLAAARAGESTLLIAPTGGGKTLAGFLPSLIALAAMPPDRPAALHTLYVSPLKALGTDIARNLTVPVEEMGLAIRIETRSGDTPANRRARQRENPPDILLTTPESLAAMLSFPDAATRFASLSALVMDEVHALAGSKRGDQLALCAARLARLSPALRRVGLSATVAHPGAIAAYVGADRIVTAPPGAAAEIDLLLPAGRLSWSGHMGLDAAPEILARIAAARLSIVFVNTRAQAELLFQALWRINAETLPIALHHGSLDIAQRRKVEAAMAAGRLRAVIATSSLDLGLDWGAVDQVLQVGAPKGVARLAQRIGRANHRMDEASRAVLVPANRFEVLECEAAREGMAAGELDGEAPRAGGLDVLAQHILGMACAAPFLPEELYAEIRGAAPYATLSRQDFDDVLGFVAHGGYALSAYERFRRLFQDAEGRVHVAGERAALRHRMNIGTIVEEPLIAVRLAGRGRAGRGARGGGAMLGEVEEYFAAQLRPGDTFLFAGRLLRFRALSATALLAEEGGSGDPAVPAYAGGRLPLSTYLAARVRAMLHAPRRWKNLPAPVRDWLAMQRLRSRLPGPDDLLVETFPRGGRWYLIAYCFEGRNAHQTLGMLLTRRMARAGLAPMGFVATDYVLGIWSAAPPSGIDALFEQDMLGEDLDSWMAESSMLRRGFRNVAVIAGLIERHLPGAEKNRRQVTISSDLLYDVLRKHQPDHVLLRAARADAAAGMIDLDRIAALLARAAGRITHVALDRVSPLAVPVLLEIGRESVGGAATEEHLLAEAEALAAEAAPGGTAR